MYNRLYVLELLKKMVISVPIPFREMKS